jgi:CHAD domain-containing protein
MTFSNISAEQQTADVALVAIKESLAGVLSHFQTAIQEGPDRAEHVHQLRVATRRTAAALKLFDDFLPRRRAHQIRQILSELRKEAGKVRDIDVFMTEFAERPPTDEVIAIHRALEGLRSEEHESLRALHEQWGRGERLEQLATELLCRVRPRRSQVNRAEESFQDYARRCLRRLVRRFFGEHKVEPKNLKQLHAFRIRTKGLRYSLEILQPGLPDDRFRKTYGLVKKLSQQLGDINDCANAEGIIESLLQKSDDQPTDRMLRECLEDTQCSLQESLGKFHDWWTRRRQRRLRRQLKRTAAEVQDV